jgi:archaemetzincin
MIKLIPFEELSNDILTLMLSPLADMFHQKIEIMSRLTLGRDSWNPERGQHAADTILDMMPQTQPGDRYLGVLEADIFAFGLNFVFGEADSDSKKAIISLARLKPEFYGQPHQESLLRERILVEATHELGHTYYLKHCPNRGCAMHFSNSIEDSDAKGWKFCPVCQKKISKYLK